MVLTLKSMSLQLRLPDGPDGKERWFESVMWGFCDTDAEADAYRRLNFHQGRNGEQWRLVKVYQFSEVVE